MEAMINAVRRFIANWKENWKIETVPGLVVGYDSKCLYLRREIPFTLFVRKGRKKLATTELYILEWAEKVFDDRGIVDVHVCLLEDDVRKSGTIIRRAGKKEIVTSRGSDTFRDFDCQRMGTGRLGLHLT